MIRNRLLRGKYILVLLLYILTTLIGSQELVTARDSSFNSSSYNSPAERRYKAAKDYYYRLRRDQTIQEKRSNWVKGTREFRHIYLDDPKGEIAPNCLFMLGTMHYRMYLRFQLQEDIDEAITYYSDVWRLFPDNTLADDAMFWAAEIYKKHKNSPDKAARLYANQVRRYPDGDKYAQALNRLREFDDQLKKPGRETLVPASVESKLHKVLPVQYWSSDDYTRIVIRSSGPVTYTSSLRDKQGNEPRKLVIDFAHSTIDRKYTNPVAISDGLLKKIISNQLNPTTVRINLDIESISTYKIFSLNDPFRVIVDVHGQQKVLSASKTVPKLNRERVESPNIEPLPPAEIIENQKPARPANVEQNDLPAIEDETFIVLNENNKRKPGAGRKTAESGQNELSLAQQLGLRVRRIVIDPGHGGRDPGAMGNGLKEKDITLKVARKVADQLRLKYNYEVILTRNSDRSLQLEERTAIANTKKADLFVSIHVNAHPNKMTRGIETFYLNLATNTEAMRVAALENSTSTLNISDMQDILTDLMQNSKIQESSVLAEYIQNSMVSGLRENRFLTTNLGVKQAPFYVLIGAEMPAVLAEISFISNALDAKLLRQEYFLNEIAKQIAAGVAGYAEHQATAALQL